MELPLSQSRRRDLVSKVIICTLAVSMHVGFTNPANAGVAFETHIAKVRAYTGDGNSGWFLVFPTDRTLFVTKCGAGNDDFAIDSNTSGGKAAIATILSALASGNKVNLVGVGGGGDPKTGRYDKPPTPEMCANNSLPGNEILDYVEEEKA